jgi:hypothetical protein
MHRFTRFCRGQSMPVVEIAMSNELAANLMQFRSASLSPRPAPESSGQLLRFYLGAASVTDCEMDSNSCEVTIDFSSESDRESFALPGPWSIGVGADFEQARACPCFLPWAIPTGREVLLAS